MVVSAFSVQWFFPTSLCGILVFDSVSRVFPASSSRLRCHTSSFTHNFVTHHLLHTHTIFVNHLCQPPSFTHHLSHTISHTHLCQPPSFTHHLLHTIFHTPSFTHTHHLSHTSLPTTIFDFAWQAWHLVTSTFVLRGRRGTYGTGLALVARLGWD